MEIKIPKEIQIIGRKLEIKFFSEEEMNGDWGSTNFDKCIIKINKNLDHQQQEITLLHEIIHNIFHSVGEKELRWNEKVVDCLSEVMYQVIQQLSPKMVKVQRIKGKMEVVEEEK